MSDNFIGRTEQKCEIFGNYFLVDPHEVSTNGNICSQCKKEIIEFRLRRRKRS